MSDNSIRVVSLFSGIGGFEVGLELAGVKHEVVFASEIDKFAQISYSSNFGNDKLYGDITKINEHSVPDHDLLVAGFPCQSFSIAGGRNGFLDTRGTLFFEIERIIKVKKPKYILLENVKNLVSHDNTRTIRLILWTLQNLGYTIDFSIINSLEAGLPQNRDRTYIIGVLGQVNEKFEKDHRNIKVDRLKTELNTLDFKSFNFFNKVEFSNTSKYLVDIIDEEVDEKFYYDNETMEKYLSGIKIEEPTQCQSKIVKLFDLPKEIHNDLERQRRVYSIKGVSPTILARMDSTKILINSGGKKRIRKLSPQETFLIQGFSSDFINRIKDTGMSDTQLYKQSGNAVSPPVIAEIARSIDRIISTRTLKFIDLFSGIGGFRLALEDLGGECVFSSEIDKDARETYKLNFGEYPSGDITKIESSSIPDHDILCAGFPCQPFSLAGRRLGFEDTRGTLFFDILRILKDKKPKAFILENVAGIISHDKGRTISIIEDSLKNAGYNIKYQVVNAYKSGIPQNRNRWYCVGFRKEIIEQDIVNDFKFPKAKPLQFNVKDCLEQNVSEDYRITEIAKNNIIMHLDDFISKNKQIGDQPLIANEIRKSRCNFRADGISPCLTAKMGTGGNNVPVLVKEMRKLTERECLNLMGFPEKFIIKENNYQSYKQIGNSVIVPIIREIGEEVFKFISRY